MEAKKADPESSQFWARKVFGLIVRIALLRSPVSEAWCSYWNSVN
jgi:hypothetical protein